MLDQHLADELALYTVNDSGLYNRCRCCALNLARKHKRGIYDPERAVTLFTHVISDAATQYRREFGPFGRLSRATKRAAAADLLERFEDEIQELLEKLNAGAKITQSDVVLNHFIRDI